VAAPAEVIEQTTAFVLTSWTGRPWARRVPNGDGGASTARKKAQL